MPNSRRFLLALLPLLVLLMAFRQAPLVDPAPIAVPANISQTNVGKAIEMSLIHRGWTASNKTDGALDGTLNLREHTANIHITWDARNVQISYVSSNNLKYEEAKGQRLIHKNYLSWIENLVLDIKSNMVLLEG
jgi:hypothetical protein